MEAIVPIQLADLKRRLADQGLELQVTDGARAVLAQRGYDPKFGARPLRRLIQTEVTDPLATMLITEGTEGRTRAEVDAQDGEVQVRLV
jgi:ATP-dependent Clp protease ATP-binding subunit ClpA